MRVTVYCASSSAAHPEFAQAAHNLGTLLAREGATTVYGGGAIGSMGRLADGALAADGRVVGILPRFMGDLEWAHPRLSEVIWTETMAERKQRLAAEGDAMVTLPGGTGTLEELLEVLTLKRLGLFLAGGHRQSARVLRPVDPPPRRLRERILHASPAPGDVDCRGPSRAGHSSDPIQPDLDLGGPRLRRAALGLTLPS